VYVKTRRKIVKKMVSTQLIAVALLAGVTIFGEVVTAGPKGPLGRVGGPCAYDRYPGAATITRIEKTAVSKRQVKVKGGPGYEGYEVWFRFKTDKKVTQSWARKALQKDHLFQLMNSWYVGEKYIEKYGFKTGKVFKCTMMVITRGTCSPIVFRFDKLDRTDYFETRR